MGRKLLILLGLIFSLVGSVGLVLFGPVVVQLLLVSTWDPNTGPTDLLQHFRFAAAAATFVALGATLLGFVAQRDSVRLSVTGKGFVALAGAAVVLGTIAILFGLVTQYRTLQAMAASATSPLTSDLVAAVTRSELPVRAGFALLTLSQILCFGAALGLSPMDRQLRGPTVVKLAGVTYMLTGWIIALLFVAGWWLDAQGVVSAAAAGGLALDQLSRAISGVLIKSALICFCLFMQAGCLAAIGFSELRRN